jgi:hypothetical protein
MTLPYGWIIEKSQFIHLHKNDPGDCSLGSFFLNSSSQDT